MALAGLFVLQSAFTRALTIDHTQVPSTQTDFPVLVNFTDTTFKTTGNGGHVNATNAFTFSSDSAGVNLLKWEVERYTASTGELIAWVKIASVSSVSDTVFYLKYGGPIVTDQSDPTNVWTNSFVQVFHYATASRFIDSVHNASPYNLVQQQTSGTTGQINGGATTSDSAADADNGYTYPTGAITLSAWAKGTAFSNSYNTVAARMFGVYTDYIILAVKSSGKLRYTLTATTARDADGTGSNTLVTGTWYYLTITYDSSSGLIGYVNASSDATVAANGGYRNTHSQNGFIGSDGAGALNFNGTVDEIRFSSVARAADWVTCEYNNQKTSSTFVTLGGET